MNGPVFEISERRKTPVSAIFGGARSGRGLQAQKDYISYLRDAGLTKSSIAAVFGRSVDWVTARLEQQKEGA